MISNRFTIMGATHNDIAATVEVQALGMRDVPTSLRIVISVCGQTIAVPAEDLKRAIDACWALVREGL